MRRIVTLECISFLLIILFTYTAVSKLIDRTTFKTVLEKVAGSTPGAGILSLLIPSVEIGIVLLLFFSRTRLIGLYASLILLLLFTVYLVYMVLFIPHLPCSCGGVISKMNWRQHIVFNLVFVVLTVVDIIFLRRGLLRRETPK